MCDDRERLIGYIYDECDAAERQRIEDHLAGCLDCRQEIAALRTVREDLLAWDVPRHATIWRPVTPERVTWRTVPGWAMAAAAALMLMSGAAGGAVAQMLLSRPEAAPTQAAISPAALEAVAVRPAPAAMGGTDLDQRLAAIRAELRAELRAEMENRVRRISNEGGRPGAVPDDVRYALTLMHNELQGVQRRQVGIEDQFETLAVAAQAQPVSFRPGQ
jgi:anti-sigma factor RsiW